MVELTLVFFAGMLLAALGWLVVLPAIWVRALRLTHQRLERALPLNTNEILAERDRDRAAFAVRRLEYDHRIEALQAEVLAAKGEIGAHLARQKALLDEIERLKALQHTGT